MRTTIPLLALIALSGCGDGGGSGGGGKADGPSVGVDSIVVTGSADDFATVTIGGKADEDPDVMDFSVSFRPGADGIPADPGAETSWTFDLDVVVSDSAANTITEVLTVTVE